MHRQAVSVHQDALMSFGEVQTPETQTHIRTSALTKHFKQSPREGGESSPQSRTESQETLQLKLLRQGCDCGENKHPRIKNELCKKINQRVRLKVKKQMFWFIQTGFKL